MSEASSDVIVLSFTIFAYRKPGQQGVGPIRRSCSARPHRLHCQHCRPAHPEELRTCLESLHRWNPGVEPTNASY